MTEAGLNFIREMMDGLSIPYDFMEWKARPPEEPNPDRYHVGEPSELPMTTMEEDGMEETSFILRGFTRGDWALLWSDARKIKKHLPQTAILPDGTGIAVFYAGSMAVPTGDMQLKSIKTNLTIKEWSVN